MLTPRPYQAEGIAFLQKCKRAMLCDAPGLGKTLQAAAAAHTPALVVCPTYLVEQWGDFLATQYPHQSVAVAKGDKLQRVLAITSKTDWVVVNTEMLRTYPMPNVKTVIFDESHYLRGRTAQQSKQAAALTARPCVEYVYMLTATPIYKEADDLYMQWHILHPKKYKSYWKFVQAYCKTLETPWGTTVVGIRDKASLEREAKGFMLGRTYKEVGMHLPDLVSNTIPVRLTATESVRYKLIKDEYRDEEIPLLSAGAVLQRLRAATCTPDKLRALQGVIDDTKGTKPIVVFCWYRETAQRVADHLGRIAVEITGDMPATQRVALAKDTKTRVKVVTLASLSEGIDLSESRTVVFFEEDYAPGRMYQALSRVRRASHHREPVMVYYILVKGTVDEVVHKLIARRVSNTMTVVREALR